MHLLLQKDFKHAVLVACFMCWAVKAQVVPDPSKLVAKESHPFDSWKPDPDHRGAISVCMKWSRQKHTWTWNTRTRNKSHSATIHTKHWLRMNKADAASTASAYAATTSTLNSAYLTDLVRLAPGYNIQLEGSSQNSYDRQQDVWHATESARYTTYV